MKNYTVQFKNHQGETLIVFVEAAKVQTAITKAVRKVEKMKQKASDEGIISTHLMGQRFDDVIAML